MRKLAVCIPTYEREKCIEEWLETSLGRLKELGYDLYIYDSGTSGRTRELVEKKQVHCENLFYVSVPEEIPSNEKVFRIFQGRGLRRKYEYIWMCGDGIHWSDKDISAIDRYLISQYDIIVVDMMDKEGVGLREISDREELFLLCAWYLTLYGACILRTDTMLGHVDWSYMERRYLVRDKLNYSHVGFYFEQLSRLDSVRALHIRLDSPGTGTSRYKADYGWRKDTFYILFHCWINTVRSLPACYHGKRQVIKKLGLYSGTLSKGNLVRCRRENIYNARVFLRYLTRWGSLTDLPLAWLRDLAFRSPDQAVESFRKEMEAGQRAQVKRLLEFCAGYERIYLYGAGRCAERYLQFLTSCPVRGFLLTQADEGAGTVMGLPVYTFAKFPFTERDGIVLALNPVNASEVMGEIGRRGLRGQVFAEYLPPAEDIR